jgi:hypothetical protein
MILEAVMLRKAFHVACWAIALCMSPMLCHAGNPKNPPKGITPQEYERLSDIIRPQPGEAKWATIPWLTNLDEARRRSAAEDKPLLVWRAGGGEVLGRA